MTARKPAKETSAQSLSDRLLFADFGMDPDAVSKIVRGGLRGADGGELYMEYQVQEKLIWGDGRLQTNSGDRWAGFGMRYVVNDATGYAYTNRINEREIAAAAADVRGIRNHHQRSGRVRLPSFQAGPVLYGTDNPVDDMPADQKIRMLEKIDAYIRAKDSRVKQVNVSLSSDWKLVTIVRKNGERLTDVRPLVHVGIQTVLEQNGRREGGSSSAGGRETMTALFNRLQWDRLADEALRQAEVNLRAIPSPAGEMPIVLGPGWPGVMLHEAVGHGLEGDFNRKGSSVYSGKVGQRVASPGVTIIDQGDIAGRRGSLHFDDEGTPTRRNVLIEDGILRGYMQDTMNARLMGVRPTGNGRRQSYEHTPMPRMTTTFMTAGPHDPEEIIRSVKRGIYATNFAGGQVDIASGNFVFAANEAYLIENGKVTAPVKGVSLVGNGPDAMCKVDMVGNDMGLDPGIGSCGKGGQTVPVGIGQPTLKMRGITVGGTGPK